MKNFIVCILITIFSSYVLAGEDTPPRAKSCTDIKTLPLGDGKKIAFHGSVLRYTQECWYLPLKKGKQLHVEISDNEHSAAIAIYQPGFNIKYGSGDLSFLSDSDINPSNTYDGITIKEAPADGEAREVNSKVKKTGNYLMVIGLSKGAGSDFSGFVQMK
ncbi:hypothetical protein [Rosenbergiella epipactidis]|uniref:hypothetical protein n=1 Tax=Rosenbergiella epipactidis TaxID=1544694 RepID=UPI001F4D6F2F|nr:hypothetical protein [Rosenbergiella epipactidis]